MPCGGSLQMGGRLGSRAGLESSTRICGSAVHNPLRTSQCSRHQQRQVTKAAVQAPPDSLERAVTDSFESASRSRIASEDNLQMSRTVLGIILGGGAGSRLYPLTKTRAKPAVPLGANYRLIDIPVSNCINSGVNKIYCMTQFNSASLNRHLASAYNANVGSYSNEGFVEVLAATQSPISNSWFQGTADAVRQYLWLFESTTRTGVEDFLILSGDHLYRMDYAPFVQKHRETGADITVAALPMDAARAEAFGVMKIDDAGRIVDFAEKPKGAELRAMEVDTTVLGLDAERAKEMPFIASMGIYVLKASAIKELLTKHFPTKHDFGSDIIPGAKDLGMKIQAYLYDGYWEDIGTIKSFYESNLALTDTNPNFSFYDKDAPIYTMSRFLPPSKVLDAEVTNSILGDGCVVRGGTTIKHSVIGLRSLIGENCHIEDALIMGSDYFETLEECALLPGCLPVGLGPGCTARKCIIDKNSRIGANVQIVNKDGVQEASREDDGFFIKDGIIVVTKGAVLPAGTVI